MAVTTVFSNIKEYFFHWHQDNYEVLHQSTICALNQEIESREAQNVGEPLENGCTQLQLSNRNSSDGINQEYATNTYGVTYPNWINEYNTSFTYDKNDDVWTNICKIWKDIQYMRFGWDGIGDFEHDFNENTGKLNRNSIWGNIHASMYKINQLVNEMDKLKSWGQYYRYVENKMDYEDYYANEQYHNAGLNYTIERWGNVCSIYIVMRPCKISASHNPWIFRVHNEYGGELFKPQQSTFLNYNNVHTKYHVNSVAIQPRSYGYDLVLYHGSNVLDINYDDLVIQGTYLATPIEREPLYNYIQRNANEDPGDISIYNNIWVGHCTPYSPNPPNTHILYASDHGVVTHSEPLYGD